MSLLRSGKKLALFFVVCFLLAGFAQAASGEKTWQSDLDWSSWGKTNVTAIGSNNGMKLSDDGHGGYATSGSLDYKYSPGGNVKWQSASLSLTDSAVRSSRYTWVVIGDKDTVSQIDVYTGQIVKEWPVGINPSRTAIGLNNDVWVANMSSRDEAYCTANPSSPGCQDTSRWDRLNTISHIIPAENRVVTKKIISGDSSHISKYPRSISIDSSNHLFVGLYSENEIVELDGNTFDSTDSYLVKTITTPAAPYGSIMGRDGKLYVAHISSGITVVNASSGAVEKIINADDDGNVLGVYGLSTDNFGNIWATSTFQDGRIVRIDHTTGAVISYTPFAWATPSLINAPVQVSVIPGSSNSITTLAVSFLNQATLPSDPALSENAKWGRVGLIDLVGNDGASPTIGNIRLVSSGCGVASGLGISSDDDGNIWYTQSSSCSAKLLKSASYVQNQTLTNNSSGGSAATYNDFIGNAVRLSSISTAMLYSDQPITGSNTGISDISKVAVSSDLYIKINLSGTRNSSPVVKALKINYQTGGQNDPVEIIERSTYSDSKRQTKEATFEAGSTVYVRLTVNEPTEEKSNFEISDGIDSAQAKTSSKAVFTDSLGNQSQVDYKIEGGQAKFNLPKITVGKNILDYEYQIAN